MTASSGTSHSRSVADYPLKTSGREDRHHGIENAFITIYSERNGTAMHTLPEGWDGIHLSHGIVSLFQRQMLLASLLGVFDSAELEYTARIVFGCNGPPTGTVSQEPFKV